ncbi:hypothetical protein [Heliorestis convoluta]|uniref:LITAF domain-containing protein n=1 Tax=Heliorestis convoluta TaxID=356322 RepID=A0A5Q2MZU8_9FIRM|nr:hypothetical protein [Heliorestis convoluta]QGG48288.1 hypothetical protein FTV88_2190 [Heliorestis convoluta]
MVIVEKYIVLTFVLKVRLESAISYEGAVVTLSRKKRSTGKKEEKRTEKANGSGLSLEKNQSIEKDKQDSRPKGALTCPRCSSSSVKEVSKKFMSFFVFAIGTIIFLLFAIIYPYLFFGVLLPWAIAVKILRGKAANHCADCKYTWPVS